ncbi:nucleoside diphosphate kinase regulator [Alkalibacter saccharofermentans]|uniref:GreA/GreB family elongation factor n=1 Tax=Alkalibacter saccharofermentans DSM 14828 TaxID=1120975 RepID=A0A1M4ZMS1_9FIRM|nr:nucleoside diphosphate kinase regulator [Alkalibacter saccharofermentans]SHF19301.1 GreA/GreB family elongation factor [Alkalibacter saccharofermentans DSM 14828]
MSRNIYITEKDKNRILEHISHQREFGGGNKSNLDELERELGRATVVDSKDVPPDIVTMNTVVQVSYIDEPDDIEEYTLVYPKDADVMENKISILAPIGTALIGFKEGSDISWKTPGGIVEMVIKKILYQPEASGDYES